MNNDILNQLELQLEAVNAVKQENDKNIKEYRKLIQEKIKSNESLQDLSNRLYAEIKKLKENQVNTLAYSSNSITNDVFLNKLNSIPASEFIGMLVNNSNNTNVFFNNGYNDAIKKD